MGQSIVAENIWFVGVEILRGRNLQKKTLGEFVIVSYYKETLLNYGRCTFCNANL